MSLSSSTARASLASRVQGIILRPKAEWDLIDREPATIAGLFTGYAMILAAIGPVCSAVGALVFGRGVPGIAVFHPNPLFVILGAVLNYALALVATYVIGFIIDALAPTFGGAKNSVQAMKVAVYGSTAAWLAGVFQILPFLGVLGLLGLYSLYLYYTGLPRLMKTGEDKALGYTALVVVCYIVLVLVIGALTAPLMFMGAAAGAMGGTTTTTVITTN